MMRVGGRSVSPTVVPVCVQGLDFLLGAKSTRGTTSRNSGHEGTVRHGAARRASIRTDNAMFVQARPSLHEDLHPLPRLRHIASPIFFAWRTTGEHIH